MAAVEYIKLSQKFGDSFKDSEALEILMRLTKTEGRGSLVWLLYSRMAEI